MNDTITRRDVLGAGAVGILTAGLFGAADAQAKQKPVAGIDLNDPQQRLKAKVKIYGSLAGGPVHTFLRLHIYGYANDGNLVPFFSMNNYSCNVWRKLESGNYAVKVYECGVYTAFDSYEPITQWTNPFTQERREIQQFRSGPLSVEYGPDGMIAGPETTVKPKPMMTEIIEDTVLASTQSSFHFPSPFQPEEFPKESPGKMFYWDSHYSHLSPLAAVADPHVLSAPANIAMNNLVSWSPWLAMSQKPGRTYGRGAGRKISGPQALPAPVLESIQKFTPQVLDIDNWGPPYNDTADYKAKLKAGR